MQLVAKRTLSVFVQKEKLEALNAFTLIENCYSG